MPSWHPLTQTGPRFGILPSLGRSSRLLGHGQPRPIRWFSRIVWGARIKWALYDIILPRFRYRVTVGPGKPLEDTGEKGQA
jgi:hypothetical protein